MRKIAMAAVFVGLLSGAAHAQGVATQNVNLTATVGGYCTIDGGPTGIVRNATVPVANGVVTSGNLPIGGASGQVICTLNARIQLTSANAGLIATPSKAMTRSERGKPYRCTSPETAAFLPRASSTFCQSISCAFAAVADKAARIETIIQ